MITTVKDIIYIFCRNQRSYTNARVNPTHARTHAYIRTHAARRHALTHDIHIMRIVERTSTSQKKHNLCAGFERSFHTDK